MNSLQAADADGEDFPPNSGRHDVLGRALQVAEGRRVLVANPQSRRRRVAEVSQVDHRKLFTIHERLQAQEVLSPVDVGVAQVLRSPVGPPHNLIEIGELMRRNRQ